MKVVGLDLSGSIRKGSGMCFIEGDTIETVILYSDEEILDKIRLFKAELVAIDAPLSLPKGREGLEDRNGPHLRECDRELLRRKIKFFPLTLGPMRKLTERGINLKRVLEQWGFRVIEVYPGGAQDIWGLPRKGESLEGLRTGLKNVGIKGDFSRMSHDELDAVTAALVGLLYLVGECEEYGDRVEGTIVMPKSGSLEVLRRLFLEGNFSDEEFDNRTLHRTSQEPEKV
jgi:predicted nuclease with RNAse H fold